MIACSDAGAAACDTWRLAATFATPPIKAGSTRLTLVISVALFPLPWRKSSKCSVGSSAGVLVAMPDRGCRQSAHTAIDLPISMPTPQPAYYPHNRGGVVQCLGKQAQTWRRKARRPLNGGCATQCAGFCTPAELGVHIWLLYYASPCSGHRAGVTMNTLSFLTMHVGDCGVRFGCASMPSEAVCDLL